MDCVITTVSITPVSEGLTPIEVSRLYGPVDSNSLYSSINRGGLVFPIKISPPLTDASVATTPSSSKRRYAFSPLYPLMLSSAFGISKLSRIPPGYCFASASYTLKKNVLPKPLSTEDLLKTIASSMLYPSKGKTATTQFCPAGLSSKPSNFIAFVLTIGVCGYSIRCCLT